MSEPSVGFREFRLFEAVRRSGNAPMSNVKLVCVLSGLSPEQVVYIRKNYLVLLEEYGEKDFKKSQKTDDD